MKDIKTLSNDLKISKEAIYKKLNYSLKVELRGHTFKKDGKTYVDEVGEALILQSLRRERQESLTDQEEEIKQGIEPNVEPIIEPKLEVKSVEYIAFLQSQLKEKDKQLELVTNQYHEQLKTKDKQIEGLMQMNDSLLSTFQNQQKLLIAENLIDLQQSDPSDLPPSPEGEKKSFFQRIFGNK